MHLSRLLPVLVLLIAGTTVLLSLALSGPENAWVFTAEKARPLATEQLRWWFIFLPLGLGAAFTASLTAVFAVRSARQRRYIDAVNTAAVGVLGIAAVFSALSFGEQWRWLQHRPNPRPRPLRPSALYIPEQWWGVLDVLRDRDPKPHLREDGLGIKEFPGFIPFDPFLLDRVSFVGLSEQQVTALLGPPRPRQAPWDRREPPYVMLGGPGSVTAELILHFDKDDHGNTVVISEGLDFLRPVF